MITSQSFKKWNMATLTLIAVIILAIVVLLEGALWRLNEKWSVKDGIDLHAQTASIYGRTVFESTTYFKKEMVKRKYPDILPVGSSRVMQFRQEFFFNGSFYNAGGCIQSIETGIEFFRSLDAGYKPKVIIFGVDIWWFNGNLSRRPMPDDANEPYFMYYALVDKINKGVFSLGKIWKENYSGAYAKNTDLPAIGFRAALTGGGFRPDGSSRQIEPADGWESRHGFRTRLSMIREGDPNSHFPFTEAVSKTKLANFENLLQLMEATGAQIYVFLPPFPHVVYEELRTHPRQRDFFKDFRERVKEICDSRNLHFSDLSDLALLGPDIQAMDGVHPGERIYGKITLEFFKRNFAVEYINAAKIQQLLADTSDPLFIVD